MKSSVILVLLTFHLLSAIWSGAPSITSTRVTEEFDPISIPLAKDWADPEREYSGAAVYEDSVILMPQYPDRVANRIPMFPIKFLLAPNPEGVYLPELVAFDDDGVSRIIEGFEGFEAIAFEENNIFVTVESHRQTGMMGYLIRGKVIHSISGISIKLDASSRTELLPRAALQNMSDEAIVILPGKKLLTFYEANGPNVVKNPTAYLFDVSGDQIKKLADVPMPGIEYRITDCSPASAEGDFWCINYMYPGDESKLNPGKDFVAEQWGVDRSQSDAWSSGNRMVERLLQLRFDGHRVLSTVTSPIYLKLGALPRNWEGLAFVPGKGFFIATDEHPTTLFDFIKH